MIKKTILTAFLFFPLLIFSQYNISGKVIDAKTKEYLPNANILINDKGIISDLNGDFFINNLKSGTYTIKISYVGYQYYSQEIVLDSNKKLVFELSPASLAIDIFSVTANRAAENTGITYQNINTAELKKANLVKDLPYILNMTPAVVSSSEAGAGVGYTSIRIRGTDITRINVTMNDIPMNDAESQDVYWVNTPDLTSSLSSIQIQRGVGTSSNGAAAFGASINMISETETKKPSLETDISYGSFNTQKYKISASSGLIDNKWTFDTRLSKIHSDGYIDRAFSDLKSLYVSAAHYGENSTLRFNIISGKEKTYQAWEGVPKDSLKTNSTYNPYTYDNQTDNYTQTHYQILYTKTINNFWNLNGALHLTTGKGYFENWETNDNLSNYGIPNFIISTDTISSTDLVNQKWLDNYFYGFTFSADYNKNNLQMKFGASANQYNGNHFGKIIWAKYALMGKDYEWYRGTGLKNTYNTYGKFTYSAYQNLYFYSDIQYRKVDYWINGFDDKLKNITNDYHYNFINPKIGLTYKLSNKSNISAYAAISNREPSRTDFVDAPTGKIPKYETLTDYELGYSNSFKKFAFTLNTYFMNYKNQLVLTGKVNDVGATITTNVDKSYRVGIEACFGAQIKPWLNWRANISLSQNKIKDFTEYIDNWNTGTQDSNYIGETNIAFSPTAVASNQFQITPLKNAEIIVNTKFISRQYIDNTSNKYNSLNPYSTTDLNFNYKLKLKSINELEFNFSINNIFNAHFASNAWVYSYLTTDPVTNKTNTNFIDGYFPQAGINFMIGINIKLY